MGSVESWRRAALAAYVLAGAGLASGGYALATTQANVNAIAAAQKRLDDDEWSKHQAHAKTDSARSAAGEGVALDIALSGRVLDASEALEHGLCSRVVEDPRDVAESLAENDPTAMKRIKARVRDTGTVAEQERSEREAFRELIGSVGDES